MAFLTMNNKYGIEISKEAFDSSINRLTNQLWKLIPMRENNEDWDKQLDTVIIDIAGKDEIFLHNSQFLQLLSKLEGLAKTIDEDIDFVIYRKIVFESINILQRFIKYA